MGEGEGSAGGSSGKDATESEKTCFSGDDYGHDAADSLPKREGRKNFVACSHLILAIIRVSSVMLCTRPKA